MRILCGGVHMSLLLDITTGPFCSPSDTVSKYIAIRCGRVFFLKHLPPMPQQQLQKVIKGHRPPVSDLHEPALSSPKKVPLCLFPPFFLIKIPESDCLNYDGLQSSQQVGRKMMGKAVWKDAERSVT